MAVLLHLRLSDVLPLICEEAEGLDGVRVAVGTSAACLREELLPSFRPRYVPAAPVGVEGGAAPGRRLEADGRLVDPRAGAFDLLLASHRRCFAPRRRRNTTSHR